MADASLVDRLAALPNLSGIPRAELEWLVAHGQLVARGAGAVIAPKGRPIEDLWVILSGRIVVYVDRGAGPRRVIEWRTGEVSGKLPFSRMGGPPGDNFFEVPGELLSVHEKHFPELMHRCPVFTAYTVHLMLDRARSFSASDLQDEKMVSLGRLAAGLAHELNNPASATLRGAKVLLTSLAEADAASRAVGAAGLPDELLTKVERVLAAAVAESDTVVRSPLQQADREDAIADWLVGHRSDPAHAAALADTAVTIESLDALAAEIPAGALDAALDWIATASATRSVATDIERAATRIYELVAAIKQFTYMDRRSEPESVEVEVGLRNTIRVLASKAKAKAASITLKVDPALPRVCANGGELNQVWLNLIDNALDAIPQSGSVFVHAGHELDRVVVRVADDGPGIPPDVVPRIFDPFFTTKPPGQGLGLGLEIARRLVRQYHGDITVQSRPGCTEFAVSLPAEGDPG